jgi:hypothetical protein
MHGGRGGGGGDTPRLDWPLHPVRALAREACAGAVALSRVLAACWFRVWGLWFGVRGLGFGVVGLGLGAWGLGLGFWGLGFGVWGWEFGGWSFVLEIWGLGIRVGGSLQVRSTQGRARDTRPELWGLAFRI